MRAAATVVRLMPSPTNRITLRARPAIAPRLAAWAAPSRNHQAAVSPAGRSMAGTSTCRLAVGPAALSRGCGVLTQPVSRAEDNAEASSKGRRTRAGMETTWDRGTGDYAAPLLHPASGARMAPRDHSPLAVRHDPVELPLVVVEHQRQEVTVALP